ncbi:hypothetical protein [Spirillospora sp. NBC_01491]|uniref:hypothetical protein n=1 Tax=Spirillospora sp. NBC_01491 TaxID=2976007 RepID=UPI002E2EF9D8|nr:hypothetical protein [Spirillospora sp. NBC_01491]
MTRNDKKAAVQRLTDAREALAHADDSTREQRNRDVVNAENAVRFGRIRGWNYTDSNEGN